MWSAAPTVSMDTLFSETTPRMPGPPLRLGAKTLPLIVDKACERENRTEGPAPGFLHRRNGTCAQLKAGSLGLVIVWGASIIRDTVFCVQIAACLGRAGKSCAWVNVKVSTSPTWVILRVHRVHSRVGGQIGVTDAKNMPFMNRFSSGFAFAQRVFQKPNCNFLGGHVTFCLFVSDWPRTP